jgi:hypothetical protein
MRALPVSALLLAGIAATATIVAVALRVGGANTDVGGDTARSTTSIPATEARSSRSEEGLVPATREVDSKPTSREEAARQLVRMPLLFVENDGQWPSDVKFAARGNGVNVAFTKRGMALSAPARDEEGQACVQALTFDFFSTGPGRDPSGECRIAGVHHYLIGNDPSQWRTNVPLFEAVRYDEIAPGVALVVTDREGKLEYDLHVEVGADLSRVAVTCEGALSLAIEPDGSLSIETAAGTAVQSLPKAWHELANGERRLADCRFKLTGPTSYGFDVLDRDLTSKLVVDPTVGLNWSTFLGTTSDDEIDGVATLNGLVTVVGGTKGSTFPTTSNVIQTAPGGGQDGFITRFDPSQSGTAQLVWSTYLGGSSDDVALSLDLTSTGNVAVCGKTKSSNFPTSAGAHSTTILSSGVFNAFVSYVTADGTVLSYSSYYGSTNGQSRANSIKIDSTPFLTIAGYVEGTGLHLQSAYDTGYDGAGDPFVARFDPSITGSGSLNYGTYVGSGFGGFSAASYDEAFALDIEGGFIYVAGTTASSGFHTIARSPYAAIYDSSHNGALDCFLMKLDPGQTGSSQLRYATFVGGELDDVAYGLDVNQDTFYACGYTKSGNYPVGSAESFSGIIYDSSFNGNKDAFFTKLDPNATPVGTQLRYSTFLGGSSDDVAYGVQRIGDSVSVVDGYTDSSGFPTNDHSGGTPYDTSYNGARDMFLTRFVWATSRTTSIDQLDYSTFLGNTGLDEARALALDVATVYFAGWTLSSGFPTAGSPYDASYNGGTTTGDGVVGKFTMPPLSVP